MLNIYSRVHRPLASRYHVSLPTDDTEIQEAQRLRFKVFTEEMGAWRATPRYRLPVEALDDGRTAPLPPLIKSYTRLGAMVCDEPVWDPDFNTADLLMLLPMAQLNRSYARRLIG